MQATISVKKMIEINKACNESFNMTIRVVHGDLLTVKQGKTVLKQVIVHLNNIDRSLLNKRTKAAQVYAHPIDALRTAVADNSLTSRNWDRRKRNRYS
jgi:hypothetical protein